MKVVMTIAGSDSGGCAGIQADLKAFAAMGVFGTSVITAVTAQNTTGVTDIHEVPAGAVRAQIRALFDDFEIAAVKTGMLPSAEIVECVAGELALAKDRPLVVDPVMIATSRAALMKEGALPALIERLLPMATLVTPNLHEASVLSGREVVGEESAVEAARAIRDLGPAAVLVKGGDATGDEAVDILFDGREIFRFPAPRIRTKNTHGTGCAYASAIAARLALGESVSRAVRNGKAFITEAIRGGIDVGRGHGPTNPLYFLPPWRASG
ncbi:MAG: bifunctional hydroxymethylpyrimidine kinase/phosphomethylpyrimidine kinase [Candidatus Eisenbacteria bacterium]